MMFLEVFGSSDNLVLFVYLPSFLKGFNKSEM